MDDVTRRNAIKVAAAAGIVAAVGKVTADDSPASVVHPAAVRAMTHTRAKATVAWCRSWDYHVFLQISADVRGWLPTEGKKDFAIAAAAQAAGKQVFVKYWGYDPNWGGGAGHFAGAQLSLDDAG